MLVLLWHRDTHNNQWVSGRSGSTTKSCRKGKATSGLPKGLWRAERSPVQADLTLHLPSPVQNTPPKSIRAVGDAQPVPGPSAQVGPSQLLHLLRHEWQLKLHHHHQGQGDFPPAEFLPLGSIPAAWCEEGLLSHCSAESNCSSDYVKKRIFSSLKDS